MFKKIKEQIEAFEWVSNWMTTKVQKYPIKSNRLIYVIFLVVGLIIAGSIPFLPKLINLATVSLDIEVDNSKKSVSSSGQSGGITAETVTYYSSSPGSSPKVSAEEEASRKKLEDNKRRLRTLYGELSVLSDYPLPSGDLNALAAYEMRVNKWVSEASMWIDINLGFAAREIFLNRGEGGRTWSSDYDERLNQLMSNLKGYKSGLKELLKSEGLWFESHS
jgi:hypothetical protein